MTEEKPIDVESLKDVPHIGAVSLKKLNDVGNTTMLGVYGTVPITDFIAITGMDREKAAESYAFMREELNKAGLIPKMTMTGTEHLEMRKSYPHITSGSKELDMLLANPETAPFGGFEFGSITELYGEEGAGKSQVVHSTALNILTEYEDGIVVWIDSENTYRSERMIQMMAARGMEQEQHKAILDRIIVVAVHVTEMQIMAVNMIDEMFSEKTPIKMIVVDSLTQHFRSQFLGRGYTKTKTDLLNKMVAKLKSLARTYKIPVLGVNQVYESPTMEAQFDDKFKAYGGHVLGHMIPYRLQFEKVGKKGVKRKVTYMKSVMSAQKQAAFQITDKGIEDLKE